MLSQPSPLRLCDVEKVPAIRPGKIEEHVVLCKVKSPLNRVPAVSLPLNKCGHLTVYLTPPFETPTGYGTFSTSHKRNGPNV